MNGKVALTRLKKILGGMGLREAENHLDRLIKKLAIPLEGVSPLDPNQGDNILGGRGRQGNSERSAEKQSAWYESVKKLGDRIIIIPFDKTYLNKNKEVLRDIAKIFGMEFSERDFFRYETISRNVNLLSGIKEQKRIGDLSKLKELFPDVWSKISNILKSKNLKEEDVVYVIYEQEGVPNSRNPHFFAHDYGHIAIDSTSSPEDEDEANGLKGILKDFILQVSELYFSEPSEDGKSYTIGKDYLTNSLKDDNYAATYLEQFFKVTSNNKDIFADIFAYAASGILTLDGEIAKVPNTIYEEKADIDYFLEPGKEGEASKLLLDCIERINDYMNPKWKEGGFAPGPLSHLRGKVVLQDV